MVASLAGTSPYKQWDFTVSMTVRCVNCHAAAVDVSDPGAIPPAPAPGASSDTHTSSQRGILRMPYRDGTYLGAAPAAGEGLKPADEPYAASDFALCYQCHGEAGLVNPDPNDTSATNFGYHGFHLGFPLTAEHPNGPIADKGNGGLDIDTAGAGQGNAICAECHFRTHSNALAVNEGDRANTRLVNFAPNIGPFDDPEDPANPYNGKLEWAAQAGGGGTCTLTCHGYSHEAESYP
jgi:hypothetical protein